MARVLRRVFSTGWPLALLLGGAMLAAPASAQAPAFLTQWGAAGSGGGQFHDPRHVAADHEGNVYVQDYDARIQKFSSEGAFLIQWGGAHSCESGQFGPFTALGTDAAGDLYVADASCKRVQKFTTTGTLLAEWNVPSPNPAPFTVKAPEAMTVDAAGAVYVAHFTWQTGEAGIWKFTGTGVLLSEWSPGGRVQGLATDAAGNVYATLGGTIKKFTSDGALLAQWSAAGTVYGIAVDVDNSVYVSDVGNDRMLRFTTEGTLLAQWGSFGSGDGQFNDPKGVAVDGDGNVYVVDSVNQRIQKFGYIPTGARPTSWGRLKQHYR